MSDPSQKQAQKILVIAGDGAFGEKVEQALKDSGYSNVHLMKNGTDGLKGIYDILPHLILLDITLPGMDGYEILAKKQAEPLLAKIPVFLMSTQGLPINMRNVPPDSVTEFIMAMHADPKDIVVKVNRHFGHEADATESGDAKLSANVYKKKMLWVEDDKLIGTILAKKLISSGFELFHAKKGEEALEILKTTIPDVIAVDLILPGMSGFDILQQINTDERLKKVPKMVLSNLSKPSDIEKARILGATKFLVKASTSLDQIVAEVKAMC